MSDVAATRRWANVIIAIAVGAMLLDLIAGGAALALGRPIPLSIILGVFLISFGVLKFTVATDAVIRLRARIANPNPVETHGSSTMAWAWVVYKYIAATVAVAAAIYLFTGASGKIDALMR